MFRQIVLILCCVFLSACGAGFSSLDQFPQLVWTPTPNENRDIPDATNTEEVETSGGTPGYKLRGTVGEITEEFVTANGWTVKGVFRE